MRRERGITLIALVITIIVLIILAGISIQLILGENGIITKAKQSSKDYKISKTLEKLELEKADLVMKKEGEIPTVGEYIRYLIEKEIITDVDVTDIEEEIKEIIADGFIFLVEKEENGNIKITYQGEADGKPRIAIIKVLGIETDSITIKVLASQVNGGTFSYRIKDITAGEEMYIEKASKIQGNEYTFENLTIGNEYKIQVMVENSKGSDTKETNDPIKTKIIEIENIVINQEEVTIKEGETTALIATILPENATYKNIIWTSSDEETATVDSNGIVTAKAIGSTTITASTTDSSGKTATCYVTVTGDQSDWKLLNKIAKAIAQDEKITYTDTQATVNVDGREHTIKVGDLFKLKYNGIVRDVRVLGFKHDELVNKMSYGIENEYAGISFEFIAALEVHDTRFLTDNSKGGFWPGSNYRIGYESDITNEKLSNAKYIKKVYKPYTNIEKKETLGRTEDYLWFLSASEIWGKWFGEYIRLPNPEKLPDGKQYAFYQSRVKNSSLTNANTELTKTCKNTGSGYGWWLRTPERYYNSDGVVYVVYYNGALSDGLTGASHRNNEIPGFSI